MRSVLLACLFASTLSAPTLARAEPLLAESTIYELRVYYPEPGKLSALNARFRDHTLKLFEKHRMRNVAYWNERTAEDAPDGRVIYILAYPSIEAREASWKAFLADPVWHQVSNTSEKDGKILRKIDSTLMSMTDYSPRLPFTEVERPK